MKKKNGKYQSPDIVDKIAGYVIYGFYAFLLIFFLISQTKPEWMIKAGKREKNMETAAMINSAIAASMRGDNLTALNILELAAKKSPDMDEIYSNMGLSYSALGDFAAAAACYEKAITLYPTDSSNIYYMLAGCYDRINLKEKSAEFLRKSLDVNGFQIDKFMKMGSHLLYQGKWDSSLAALTHALQLQYSMKEHYRNTVLTGRVKLEDDTAFYNKVSKWVNKADSTFDDSKYDNRLFTIQVNRDKRSAVIHNQLGFDLSMLGNDSLALIHFEKAVEIWNDYPDALKNMKFVRDKIEKKQPKYKLSGK